METKINNYLISDDKSKIQPDRVCELLAATYWAEDRSREAILSSIENSLCFGAYLDDMQVGFARCVTDCATIYWLADVIVNPEHRGKGLGKALVEAVVTHPQMVGLNAILATRNAHGLYEQYGFQMVQSDLYMRRNPE
ncbi:MAG: GNAT family N-acetyltransferase [Oscillospiraceae bacterium]|nr:GNAT family N-acetyltransferase [Oscillospiraceae bacterium]